MSKCFQLSGCSEDFGFKKNVNNFFSYHNFGISPIFQLLVRMLRCFLAMKLQKWSDFSISVLVNWSIFGQWSVNITIWQHIFHALVISSHADNLFLQDFEGSTIFLPSPKIEMNTIILRRFRQRWALKAPKTSWWIMFFWDYDWNHFLCKGIKVDVTEKDI